jgi:ribose transport system ATP-binding protein
MDDYILEFSGINKTFPGVKALDDVSFKVRRGDVHALVGENGAGKSTLLKILNGNYSKDSGKIIIDLKEVEIPDPVKAREKGISIIFQELNLIPHLSVAENIYLGRLHAAGNGGKIIDWKGLNRASAEILKKIGYDINPRALTEGLSVAEKQMVEIAKALSFDSKIILMDEPSATLTQNELQKLFAVIKDLKSKGVTVIYISHRLEEIFEICSTVTVMRDGKVVDTTSVTETTKNDIIKKMVGREVSATYPRRQVKIGEEVMKVKQLSSEKVKDISFSLNRGEILGVAGLVGAGRTEMVRALFGVDYTTKSEIYINGKRVRINSPAEAMKNGMAYLTEDRKSEGLILEFTVRQNISMASIKKLIHKVFVNKRKEVELAYYYIENLSIKTPSIEQKVLNLSGGNQQKIVIGKWLGTDADIFIMDEPTRGIDVGSKHEIYELMNRFVNEGKGIIFISSELPEIIGMSDRVLVMRDGRIKAELGSNMCSAENIMQCAVE